MIGPQVNTCRGFSVPFLVCFKLTGWSRVVQRTVTLVGSTESPRDAISG